MRYFYSPFRHDLLCIGKKLTLAVTLIGYNREGACIDPKQSQNQIETNLNPNWDQKLSKTKSSQLKRNNDFEMVWTGYLGQSALVALVQ